MIDSPTISEVVGRVCALPADLHKRGDASPVRLLEESGYDAVQNSISVVVIQQHLETHPQLIDDWAGYSQDQRCEGWYFDDSRLAIGHYSQKTGITKTQMFGDRAKACAEYVKRELETLHAICVLENSRKRKKRKREN